MTTSKPRSGRLNEQVCLVTGATSGIGKETARALAGMGATVVLVARDESKANATRAAIEQDHAGARVHVLLADLASQQAIRAVAQRFLAQFDRLHVLVNNAGAILGERQQTPEGIEQTFAVNHLAYFLLTRLLTDVLIATPQARVVNVASEAHRAGRLAWDDISYERRRYSSYEAYGTSKLANILWSGELARRLSGTGVTSNALHPGVIGSSFGQSGSALMRLTYRAFGPLMRTAKKGAATSIYLASSAEVAGQTGLYFSNCKAKAPSARARDRASAERLWALSEQLTQLPAPKPSDHQHLS